MSEQNNIGNNKRIAKNTLVLYVRMFLMMAIGVYTTRVILEALGNEDYGIYNVVGGFVSMFSVFQAGLTSATQRFIAYDLGKGNLQELKRTFFTCIVIYFMISIIIVIFAEIAGIWFLENKLSIPYGRIVAARWTYQLSLLTLIIGLISTPYNALIISHERMKAFAYISIYEVLAKLFVAFQIKNTCYDRLIVYAIFLCIIQISVRIIYDIYCHRNFEETKFHMHFDLKKMKEIYAFTGWAMFGSIAHMGFTQGLNVLLNIFFGPSVNAARAIAVQVQTVVDNFIRNFQTAINPQITKSYAKGDLSYCHTLVISSAKFSFFFLFFISLPIIIEADQIFAIWLKDVPAYTTLFFRIIIITSFFDAVSNPIIQMVNATGRIKFYQVTIGGMLIMIVPLSYLALRLGGDPYWVFIIHMIVGLIAVFARLYIWRRLTQTSVWPFFYNVLVMGIIVSFISLIPPLFVFIILPVMKLRILIVCLISFISTIITVYGIGLKKNEKKFVKERISIVLKRNDTISRR